MLATNPRVPQNKDETRGTTADLAFKIPQVSFYLFSRHHHENTRASYQPFEEDSEAKMELHHCICAASEFGAILLSRAECNTKP